MDLENFSTPRRAYDDIIEDLNRVLTEKNSCKLTINESLAKSIGLYGIYEMQKQSAKGEEEMQRLISLVSEKKLVKENYISVSKNAAEMKFENKNKDSVSTILMSIFQMWKQHLMYLNNEENRFLAELRDAVLPELMSGKISVEDI